MEHTTLFYREGASDKVYALESKDGGYVVGQLKYKAQPAGEEIV